MEDNLMDFFDPNKKFNRVILKVGMIYNHYNDMPVTSIMHYFKFNFFSDSRFWFLQKNGL